MYVRSLSILLIGLAGLTACGGEEDDDTTVTPAFDWNNLDSAAKGSHMQMVVLPGMTTVFQTFDAQAYANVTCDTCHGPDGASAGFAMPNANLPALPADLTPVFTNNSTVANFMAMQVVPQFATLLELTPFDPATGEGDISCFTCHTME